MVTRWLALSLCVVVIIAGCGEDSNDGGGSDTTDSPTATAASDAAPSGETPDDASDEPDTGSGSIEFTTVRGARPNSTADVVVLTDPRAECSITYTAPDGTVGEMRGLEPKTSSGNGRVTWSWKIDPDTQPGEGTVSVTCDGETAETPITIQ